MKEIFKKIFSVIMVVSLLTGFTISVYADTGDIILFKEDYQGDTYTKNIRGTGKLTTDSSTGNKYMQMKMIKNADWGATSFTYPIPAISEGLIQIQFDYMTKATTDQSYVLLTNNNFYTASEWLRLLGVINGKFNAFSSTNNLGNYTAGKWYTYQVIIDMSTHEVTATLFEQGETTPLASVSDTLSRTGSLYSDWPETSNEFVQLRHYGNNDGYIDNIEIKKIYKDPTFVFEENYDGDVITVPDSGSGEIVTDELTENRYLKIHPGWTSDSFSYKFPEISSGKISIEFDYMKDSSKQSYVVIGGSNVHDSKNWLRLLGAMAWGTGSFTAINSSTTLGPITAGQWYTQKMIINLDTREVSLAFYKKGDMDPAYEIGPLVLEKTSDGYSDWPETATSFTHFRNFGDVEAYIDNIKISYVFDDPEISANDISFETKEGVLQSDFNNIISFAKTIKLDFGTVLKESTITHDNIYVSKKGDSEKIPALLTHNNGIVTLYAENNWDEGMYTIHISKNIANSIDVTLNDDFEIDFNVIKSKVLKATFTDINGEEFECTDNISISPEMIKLDIYFLGEIDTSLLDSINIKLNNNILDIKGIYDSEKNIYSLNFNNYLKQNSNYTLDVPQGIADNNLHINFTTGAGIYEIVSLDFYDADGNVTDTIDNISNVTAQIVNTAENTNSYRLIFNAYYDNMLKNHFYKDFDILSDNANIIVTLPIVINNNVDSVKKTLWNSAEDIEPLNVQTLIDCEISDDGTVTFENKLKSNKEGTSVLLYVYRPGKSNTDLSEENDNIITVAANDNTVSESDGKYSFKFKLDGNTDFYDIVIKSDKGDSELFQLFYNDHEKAKNIREQLNNATNPESFYNLIYNDSDNWRDLGFFIPDSKVNNRAISDLMYHYVNNKNKLDTEDDLSGVKLYRKMYGIELLNEKNSESIEVMEKYLDIESENFYKYYKKDYIDEKIKKQIYSELEGCNFRSYKEYYDAFLLEIILKTVRYADGHGNIRDILADFEKETGISTNSLNSDDYRKLLGKSFESYSDIKEELKKKTSSSGSSGGGSSGGSSSNKSNGINLTVENTLINSPVAVPVDDNLDNFVFTDISDYEWAKEAINCLYKKGVISGKSEQFFYPQDNVKREEFAAMIVRALGIEGKSSDTDFTDVDENAWYTPYIKAAVAEGIIFGREDRSFGVGEYISRQDMAVIIYRALKIQDSTLTEEKFSDDEAISKYAKNAVYAMKNKSVLSGFDDGTFKPLNNASRAQAAVMIYRAFYSE